MADRECVLRFLAFRQKEPYLRQAYEMRDYTDYSGRDDLDTFLNEHMKHLNLLGKKEPHYLKLFEESFVHTMNIAYELFGNEAFRKPSGNRGRYRVSKALFEVWAVNLDKCTDEQLSILLANKEALKQRFITLMDDNEFVTAISYSTGTARRVQYRFAQIERIIQETISHV
jgi:hypothetical protein